MAKHSQKRLVVVLERCDTNVSTASNKAMPCLASSPRVELFDCLSFPRSLGKVCKRSGKKVKKNATTEMAEAGPTNDVDLRGNEANVCQVDSNEELHEMSVSKSCCTVVEMNIPPPISEDDQPPDSTTLDGKVEPPEQKCAPGRLSLFDQMPLLNLENDDLFPAQEDPMLADPVSPMLEGSGEALGGMGSRNSSFLGEYPAVELISGINNDVMLGDVGNRSLLLEDEEFLVPGGTVSVEIGAEENLEFGQNDFAIDDEMDWSCEQAWPLLEPGATLPDGHGLLNSSLDAGNSDDEFQEKMREEFLARRLRCSTRLQNQQRRSAERSLSESENTEPANKITGKRRREVQNLDVQEECVQKKSNMRRVSSKSNDKDVVQEQQTERKVELADGKTSAEEFSTASVSDDLESENHQSDLKKMDGQKRRKSITREHPSKEDKMKAKNLLLPNQSEVGNSRMRKNSFRASVQSSDEGKSPKKLVDTPAEEVSSAKKPSSRAKENKGTSESVAAVEGKLSKSLMNSVEAAKQKYLTMKKEREANELKEFTSEEKPKQMKDFGVNNPCREPGCSASARPDSIFCSPACLSHHVKESIKLLAQDRLKTYNRNQQPGISGISDTAKATERIVVFERRTGKLVTGPLAPTESTLLTWLQRHPTFEVLQPGQALGHLSGNLKKKRRKLLHGGRTDSGESSAVTRGDTSETPSDKTQKNSKNEGSSCKSQAMSVRSDSVSNAASHSNQKTELSEDLDPLRSNMQSELRHLLMGRLDRDVSATRVKRLASEIESELWRASRNSSSLYKQKSSGLVKIFKRPSSQDLCRRLLCAEVKPQQLIYQMRELLRSETGIKSDTKNTTFGPFGLLPSLIDTTDQHGQHVFDVSCRICTGRSVQTTDVERSQTLMSSDTTCTNKVSGDTNENTAEPEVSSHLEKTEDVEAEGRSLEVMGTDSIVETKMSASELRTREEAKLSDIGEIVTSDAVVSTSNTLSSGADSKHSPGDELLPITCSEVLPMSRDFPPSSLQSAASASSPEVTSGHFSSKACSSSTSVGPLSISATVTTSGVPSGHLSIPVQKQSCKSTSRHLSLDLLPSRIPSGYLSVSSPSIELPTRQLTACSHPSNGSVASTQTSRPMPLLSTHSSASVPVATRHSSLDIPTSVATRHSSVEIPVPSRHLSTDDRPAMDGFSLTSSSRSSGSNRANLSSSSHETLVDLVWKGSVSALDGATMRLCAYRTSGSMKIIRSVLPSTVTVMGRIHPKTVEDYLQKIRQQYSSTREIAVICFHCNDDGEKAKYNRLFSYLQERRRCGVIGSITSAIKDMYIWPLPAGTPIPTVLLPFNGPGLDVNRSDVLLGIVIQQARPRNCVPKQPLMSAANLQTNLTANSKSKLSVEPAPATQDNHAPSSEMKNENRNSPTNDDSSDEVSDDDLKAFAQADPIISKYSKVRPQDLLVQAENEEDKPYDPFEEDYEMGSVAQTPSKHATEHVLNGHQKVTESIGHREDVSLQPTVPCNVSKMTSEIHQNDDLRSHNNLTKDALQKTDEFQLRRNVDSKTSNCRMDAAFSKADQVSELKSGRVDNSVNGDQCSSGTQNTGNRTVALLCDSEKIDSREDGLLMGESYKATKSATSVSCAAKNSDKCRGSVTANGGLAAVKPDSSQQGNVKSVEVSQPESASHQTLAGIATILTQLSEKNALNQDILRSLLDQLLSVFGAQNDRDQRAILLQLVETIEKQQSVTERQQSVTKNQQSVVEKQRSVAEEQQSVDEKLESVTVKQQSMAEKQQSVTDKQQSVAEKQTGEAVAAEMESGGMQMKTPVKTTTSEAMKICSQPSGTERRAVDELGLMGDQFYLWLVRKHGLESRKEGVPGGFNNKRSGAYPVALEEWCTGGGKSLVHPGEQRTLGFETHLRVEEGRTEGGVELRSANDVANVPAVTGYGVERWKDDWCGKSALSHVGPKVNQGQSINPCFGLTGPETSEQQNARTIASSAANVGREAATKSRLIDENRVLNGPQHLQKSGNISTTEETNNCFRVTENHEDCLVENQSLAESEYPAIYQTDIQSYHFRDESTQPARREGWCSTLPGKEPVCGIWKSDKRSQDLALESRVPADGSLFRSAVPQMSGSLRSCLKKGKPESRLNESGINIEKILPVLSDSSFETLKSIVNSAKSAGIVQARDLEQERSQVHSADEHRSMVSRESHDVSRNGSFWSENCVSTFSQPCFSQSLPSFRSPERPAFSPTYSRAGRLPAPPKPPPCLLQGTPIRASIPEAFVDRQLPMAHTWMPAHPPNPGFQSSTIYEWASLSDRRDIDHRGGNRFVPFSPPWMSDASSYPANLSGQLGSVGQTQGCLQRRSFHESAVEKWSYPLSDTRPNSHATESRMFWQSNNYDLATVTWSQNGSSQQNMAAKKTTGVASDMAYKGFSCKETAEGKFGNCQINKSKFANLEPLPPPLYPCGFGDQDYRKQFCDSGTKSLIDSAYNEKEFLENSYEFFGSIPEDHGHFGDLGELLPGLGALETNDCSERTVSLCDYPTSQTINVTPAGNERSDDFECDHSDKTTKKLETAVKTEINQTPVGIDADAAKAGMTAKAETADKNEIPVMTESNIKAQMTDLSKINVTNAVAVKTEVSATASAEGMDRTETSAQNGRTVKASQSSFSCETMSGSTNTNFNLALSETSQNSVFSPEICNETASELKNRGMNKGDVLSETLASLSSLFQCSAKSEFGLNDRITTAVLQEFCAGHSTNDQEKLINDVSDLVLGCLDSDLPRYSDFSSGGLGLSSKPGVEKGVFACDKLSPQDAASRHESLSMNEELCSRHMSERYNSPKFRPGMSTENRARSKSQQSSVDSDDSIELPRGSLHLAQERKPQELGRDTHDDAKTATLINESDDCIIRLTYDSGDDSKTQRHFPSSRDLQQTLVNSPKADIESKTKSILNGSGNSSKTCGPGTTAKLKTLSHVFDKCRLRANSSASGDSIKIQRSSHDSHSSSKRLTSHSHSSCDSREKQRHRHDSHDSLEKQRYCWDSCAGQRSYRHDASESGKYTRGRDSSGDSLVKRKRTRDSSRVVRKKRRRHSHDSDEEFEDLSLSCDEAFQRENQDRLHHRRTTKCSRSSSLQSSDSENQRSEKKVARSVVDVDDDRHPKTRRYHRHFEGMRSESDRRNLPERRDGCSRSARREDRIRHDETRSPSESSVRTSGSRERHRECSDRTTENRYMHISERAFRKFCKEIQTEKCSAEVHSRGKYSDRDKRQRHRRTERTRDSRPENERTEDVLGTKEKDANKFGQAAFAGFISRRLPVSVENEFPWSQDPTHFVAPLGGADVKNLVVSTDESIGNSKCLDGKIDLDVSQGSAAGNIIKVIKRGDEQLERMSSRTADNLTNSLAVRSTSGRELQRSLCKRNRKLSDTMQSVHTEQVCTNGCDVTKRAEETANQTTGHLVVGGQQESTGQLLPNGQWMHKKQKAPNLHKASNGQPVPNLHQALQTASPCISGRRRNRAAPSEISKDEELEDGEIIEAPDERGCPVDREWPSATKDLLALLNTPKSWISLAAANTHVAMQKPGPSTT